MLDLPLKVRLHPVYYISLLELAANTIQIKVRNEPKEIKGLEIYKAEAIRNIKKENK